MTRLIASFISLHYCRVMNKKRQNARREVLEMIADRLSACVLWWGCSSPIDASGRVLCTTDAHRYDGKRFIVIADDKLTAFLNLKEILLISQMPADSAKLQGTPQP
jgi:hypothetical protein